nr:hypothetical protein LSAT_2X20640 [Ipomoea trifida]
MDFEKRGAWWSPTPDPRVIESWIYLDLPNRPSISEEEFWFQPGSNRRSSMLMCLDDPSQGELQLQSTEDGFLGLAHLGDRDPLSGIVDVCAQGIRGMMIESSSLLRLITAVCSGYVIAFLGKEVQTWALLHAALLVGFRHCGNSMLLRRSLGVSQSSVADHPLGQLLIIAWGGQSLENHIGLRDNQARTDDSQIDYDSNEGMELLLLHSEFYVFHAFETRKMDNSFLRNIQIRHYKRIMIDILNIGIERISETQSTKAGFSENGFLFKECITMDSSTNRNLGSKFEIFLGRYGKELEWKNIDSYRRKCSIGMKRDSIGLVTLRGGVEEERGLSNAEKDPMNSKELNEEPYEDFQSSRKGRETDTQLKVSKQNSILDLIDTYRILRKAVFDESRMYGLEGDLSYLSRSTTIWGKKAK